MAGFPVGPRLSLEFGDPASSLFRWYKERQSLRAGGGCFVAVSLFTFS